MKRNVCQIIIMTFTETKNFIAFYKRLVSTLKKPEVNEVNYSKKMLIDGIYSNLKGSLSGYKQISN